MRRGFWTALSILSVILFLCSICGKGNANNQYALGNAFPYQAEESESEFVSIDITYEEQLGSSVVNKVRQAVEMFPSDTIQAFSEGGWKIAVLSEISTDEDEDIPTESEDNAAVENEEPDNKEASSDRAKINTVGLTNYDTKTIFVSPSADATGADDLLTVRMVHEFAHFVDEYYGNVTDTDDWKKLYGEYKTDYVEFEFSGIAKNEENKYDIEYAASNRYEFFACSLKDFYCHQNYLRDNYSDLYVYFIGLMK